MSRKIYPSDISREQYEVISLFFLRFHPELGAIVDFGIAETTIPQARKVFAHLLGET